MRSVYIVDGNQQYVDMFISKGWRTISYLTECDLVLFTGGEDVSPYLYGEEKHPSTYNNPIRDAREVERFKECVELGNPMAGICRGGQFLNVMNGGEMWQDVDGHTTSHYAWVPDEEKSILVTSTHHQMMVPNVSVKHQLLMFAQKSGKKESMKTFPNRDGSKSHNTYTHIVGKHEVDAESIYYPNTQSLCYQPHPEFPSAAGPCRDVFFKFINEYLFGEG